MVGWYKHDIPAWMDGTEALSDGAYRAYHVICQLIYLNEGPIALNEHGIAGRCRQSIRGFRGNLKELIDSQKLTLSNGRLANSRADKELEKVGENRLKAGEGGVKSGEVRKAKSKALKSHEPNEPALQENRTEKTRLEETREDETRQRGLSLRQSIVKAFEDARSPNLPDTSRAELWLSQGYDPAIITATVRTLIAKKPSVSSLNYFDNAIREAHETKRPAVVIPPAAESEWPVLAARYAIDNYWPPFAGPEPGMGGCRCPPEILEQHKIDPKTGIPHFLKRTA